MNPFSISRMALLFIFIVFLAIAASSPDCLKAPATRNPQSEISNPNDWSPGSPNERAALRWVEKKLGKGKR